MTGPRARRAQTRAARAAAAGHHGGLFGIDEDWNRPSIRSLRHAGVKFVCGYLSHDASKNMSRQRARRLKRARILRVLVWETTATRALDGHAAGVVDARAAGAMAQQLKLPWHRPIYFACDFDASPGQVHEYFRGVVAVLGAGRVGVYAGIHVIDGLVPHVCRWGWQTYAWSGGNVSHRAQLYQYSNGHRIGGQSIDYDRSLHPDFGGF